MLAVGLTGLPLPPGVTVTLTVPPVTIVPGQELLELLLVTVLLLESVNFQFENPAPVGAPFKLHVVLLPRVTDDGEQLRLMVSPGALGAGFAPGQEPPEQI